MPQILPQDAHKPPPSTRFAREVAQGVTDAAQPLGASVNGGVDNRAHPDPEDALPRRFSRGELCVEHQRHVVAEFPADPTRERKQGTR